MRLPAVLAALSISLAAHAAPALRIETVATGLEHPWSLAFLPDGRLLVTERPGRLRIIDKGRLSAPLAGVPAVYAEGQGGLFDVVLAPDFAQSRRLYLSYAQGTADANATRLVRARLGDAGLRDVEVLFTAQPAKATAQHFGGRIAWLPDGTLLLGLGDGGKHRDRAQTLDNHFGKIVRLNADGTVPKDNPFVARKGALPEIWSYGHRNVQGIVYDAASKRVYAHEHGPRGGDELNWIRPGLNYGWPQITYGREYWGGSITDQTALPGMEQPLLHWTPSIAPAGMTLYGGKLFPQWRGDLFVSALVGQQLRRVDMDGTRVVTQEVLLEDLRERLRDVRVGPEGALYLLTDAPDGKILRVTPGP